MRVGVIGTGSSGIQSIPEIARQAAHVTVFQRTPNFSVPANNTPLSEADRETFRANYPNYLAMIRGQNAAAANGGPSAAPMERGPHAPLPPPTREALQSRLQAFWDASTGTGWLGFPQLLVNEKVNEIASDFLREKIAEKVRDPETAKRLMPHDHPVGTKRICVDTDYFETYNRDNVELVDVRAAPIQAITPAGLKTAEKEFELDAIVFATGFDAMTGALLAIDIRGPHCSLREAWADGPKSYLGLMVAGLPNLFTLTGPGSPSVLSNMITSNEQHVEWVSECIAYMRAQDLTRIEAQHDWQEKWVAHVNKAADRTLFPRANSWYIGANIPGKPRVFMPYIGMNYRQKCQDVVRDGYRGFALA
jgi:cyclohexanone monooxygenase